MTDDELKQKADSGDALACNDYAVKLYNQRLSKLQHKI